jgi:hypothetical protein
MNPLVLPEKCSRIASVGTDAVTDEPTTHAECGRRLKMGLVDRLKAIIDVMPEGGSVSLPVTWLRDLLDAEGDSPGMGRLLTLEEVCEFVSCSPSTVRTWLNTSRLDGFKLNGRDVPPDVVPLPMLGFEAPAVQEVGAF